MTAKSESEKEPYFSIGVMARLLDVSTQRIRLIEKEGFLQPERTTGKTRLYTQQDLEMARLVLTLMDELGVNAAGVEVILHMREQMEGMQGEMRRLLLEVAGYLDKEPFLNTNALVPRGSRALGILKILREEKRS